MALYHCSIKIISRGSGQSAVASAAYRSGEKITNEYDGHICDYTRKDGVVHTEILLPNNAPPEYADRAVLWNAVEKIEKAKNSQLAREVELAFQNELTMEQNISLARDYVKKHFVDCGMCADFCVHDKNDGNPHAHVMLTMRPFNEDKTWGTKQKKEYILDDNGDKIYDKKKRQYKCKSVPTTDWNEQTKAEEWREAWADAVNAVLKQQFIPVQVDHRSYKRQGIDQIPTIHLGVAAFQMEQRGIITDRGNINREISITNKQLQQLKARINKLKAWLKDEAENTEPPTLADVISEILNKEGRNTLTNLKEGSKLFSFLQQNKIMDLKDLEKKLSAMIGGQLAIRNKSKPIERRLDTLNEHFRHSDNFKQYRGHNAQYEKLYSQYIALKKSTGFFAKSKAQKALDTANEYYETNRREITLYKQAEDYLKNVLQGHYDPKKLPPVKKWKAEQADLLGQKSVLNNDYKKLKEETREVEIIRREVERIMRTERPKQRAKEQGMEL